MSLSLGLTLGNGGGTVAETPSGPELLVATRCRPLHTTTSSGSPTCIMSRTAHVAGDRIFAVRLCITNYRLIASGGTQEQHPGFSVTVTASIEYPAGTFKQVTFDTGSTSAVIADGGTEISDMTEGDLGIPEGETFWVRIHRTSSAVGILRNDWRNSALGEETTIGADATACPDRTMSTSAFGGTSGDWSAPPTLIIAQTENVKPIIIVGDSKAHGLQDTAESATAAGSGLRGEVAKAFAEGTVFFNASSGGLQLAHWDTAGYCEERKLLLPYFTHFFLQLGFNDWSVAGTNATNIVAPYENVIADFHAANASAKVTLCTLTARPTSTSGGWISEADQTAFDQTDRTNINAAIRAGTYTGNNNGYFEIADQIETARNSGKYVQHPTRARDILDAVVTAGSTNIDSVSADFTSEDAGLQIWLDGAGTAGADLNRNITSVTSESRIVVNSSSTFVSNTYPAHIGAITFDGIHHNPYGYTLCAQGVDYLTKLAA